MATLPDEVCCRCGRVIGRRARANLIGDEIVCTDCYNKQATRDAVQQSWSEPATEAQKTYAADLGLTFSPDASKIELHDLLDCHLSDDATAPDWLREHAAQIGATTNAYVGTVALYNRVAKRLAHIGDAPLAEWLIWHACRNILKRGNQDPCACGVSQDRVHRWVEMIVADGRVMKTLRRGVSAEPELAFETITGRRKTLAYKMAVSLAKAEIGG